MDTVSMLNTMSFYCQPILPLVYDESMSYYETLCKVVGQLNNTGETVNKLNEGLTTEIAARQAGDAALDERLKLIEGTNKKIHFLVFDGANPNGGLPTRGELYQWVHEGDAIFTLFRTNEEGRGQIYAASCSYNAGNWGSEASNDFNIIVPIETNYDATQDYAVKQKVAKLAIPLSPQTNLNVPWRLEIIEVNTPSTSAEGVVNVTAVVSDSGSVNCSITPSEFLQLYNMTRGGKNLCVAVNAKLAYDGLARSSSIATVDTTNRIVRIAFERDYGTAITNGVNQLNKTLDYIIGDAKTGTWVHETIDSKIFDFIRYEGFQFTHGANNVIITNDESTPNAVYAQYHSDTSGKLYQNLPTRLIDSVDGAEYWNGTFDIYGGNHMTFTFVTSNYATASDKMLVRVIELSADAGTTAWKYGVKEFELPFVGYGLIAVTSTKVTDLGYDASEGAHKFAVTFDASFDSILANLAANKPMKFNITLPDNTDGLPISFNTGYVSALGNATYQFTGTFAGAPIVLSIGGLGSATIYIYADYLPEPNPDDSDDGKVLAVNKHKWEMKTPSGGGPTFADDGAGNITVDGAAAQSANRFLQSMTFPGLNFKYLNPMNSGTYSDPYGVQVAGGASLIETVLAMTNPGVYTVYMNRNATDVPEAAAAVSSSLRGLLILSQIKKHYAIVMLVDQSSNYYIQYIQDDIGHGWKQMPIVDAALDAASTNPVQNKAVKAALDGKAGTAVATTTANGLMAAQDKTKLDEMFVPFKYFTYNAKTATADMTPAEVKAFILANPHTPIYMLITGNGTGTRPIWAVQQSLTNDTVVFVSTNIAGTTGVQKYKLVKAASDTAWSTISTGQLVTDDTPLVANPTFAEDIDGHANKVLGVGPDSAASNENLPYLTTGDYPKDTIDGMTWSDLRLNNGVFAYRDVSVDSIYNKVQDGTMLPDIDFVLSNAVLIGTVEGEITNYTIGYYNIIKDEISRNRGNIWLSFNGETIRLASWKQAGSDTYVLTFFGAGSAAQPVKYVVTASASAATLTVTGS